MAIFSDFTQGSFNPTDADSTIADSNQVVGFNSPGTDAGDERRFSIEDLKKHINKNQVVRGAGDSATSNEGGQISFCGSPNGSGNETIAWNLDVYHTDGNGLDESVRLFAAGGDRGNGMFEFQKNGKLRMGHRTGEDGFTVDADTQLRVDVHGTRATTATGDSAWVYRGTVGGNSEFEWGGTAADFPSISIGDVVCVGTQQFGETRDRMGWRAVNGLDADNRRITMPTISGLTVNNQYRLFQEDIGFQVIGKGRDGMDHSKFVVNNDRVHIPAGRLDVTCEHNLDTATVAVYGSGQSDALVYVGQNMDHGFGLLYNGDDSPNAIGISDDCILFNRTNAGGNAVVLKWNTSNTNVRIRSFVKINDDTFTQPAFPLDVEGDVRASGNIIAQSDGRYKSDTCTIDNSLEKVKRLRGVSYVKTDSERTDIGLVAQELEQVLPELVTTHKGADYDDEKSVNYNGVIPVLIEAIKEQQQQIEQLQQRVS